MTEEIITLVFRPAPHRYYCLVAPSPSYCLLCCLSLSTPYASPISLNLSTALSSLFLSGWKRNAKDR